VHIALEIDNRRPVSDQYEGHALRHPQAKGNAKRRFGVRMIARGGAYAKAILADDSENATCQSLNRSPFCTAADNSR
jgi:hypothetical protein